MSEDVLRSFVRQGAGVTPWQLSDSGERYVSSSRHAADVQTAIRECLSPRASRLPTVTARADEPESHPADRVAPDAAVIDTDTHPGYGHGVEHPVKYPSRSGSSKAAPGDDAPRLTSGAATASFTYPERPTAPPPMPREPIAKDCSEAPRWTEAQRQAWLRRVQAER